ncbi:MAG: sulfite exporter TauE/SafE family protein [Candidatus Altiarchaeota archaeon]|nr:sulfite exporter TauE/SafE family protein [Candidatus Altiarchaeota archaeon]
MKRIIGVVILILVVTGVYYLSGEIAVKSFPHLPSYADILTPENLAVALTGSFIFGLIIGSTSCPVCSLPLIGYVMGAEPTAKKAFWASITYHLGRLITFFLLGIIVLVLGYSLSEGFEGVGGGLITTLANIFVGILMILFSMELFGLIDLSKHFSIRMMQRLKIPLISVDHPLHLLVWGMFVGLGCSITQIAPLLAIFLGTSEHGLVYAVIAVLLFSVGTMITPTILLVLAGSSVEITEKYFESGLRKYAGWLGGLILLYIGLQYLILEIIRLTAAG